ncbi:MAG: hypothetical protein ACRD8Z_22390 [Nitrososphaeraceae archaeon]
MLSTDPSLKSPPQFEYPISIPNPRNGTIDEPKPQSTTWPVANPEQPLYFSFLLYQDTEISYDGVEGVEEGGANDEDEEE